LLLTGVFQEDVAENGVVAKLKAKIALLTVERGSRVNEIRLSRIAKRNIPHARNTLRREQTSKHRSLEPRFHAVGIWNMPPDCWAGWLVRKYGKKNFKM
jgi:hypothetical protein